MPGLQARQDAELTPSFAARVVGARSFQHGVLALILANAMLIGLETSGRLMASHGQWLLVLNSVFQGAFVVEIALRLAAHGRRWARFFHDGWNVFDFVVVAASLIPVVGVLATIGRLSRVVRVLRLVSAFPDLRLIVATMIRSIPSMGHVILLLGLLLYAYGVLGYHLFHVEDPTRWGTLGRALLTLFEIVTLEGWVEIQESAMRVTPWAWIYFTSFIVIAVFVVINLFIAVVINNLEAAKRETLAERPDANDIGARLARIREELDHLEASVGSR